MDQMLVLQEPSQIGFPQQHTDGDRDNIVIHHTYISELLVNIIKLESIYQHHDIELDKSSWKGPAESVHIDDVDYTRHDADYESDQTRSEGSSEGALQAVVEPDLQASQHQQSWNEPDFDLEPELPIYSGPVPPLWLRTVLFIKKVTVPGQDLFIRGGLSTQQGKSFGDKNNNLRKDGSITIQYESLGTTPHYNKYNSWRKGVTKFDWYGREEGQGSFEGMPAIGAPGAWTSNKPDVIEYQPLNTFGPHYWMLDFIMDYTQTRKGWFEFRCFLTEGDGWEAKVIQDTKCTGSAGGTTPYASTNHMARCGFMNIFEFNSPTCRVDEL